MCLSLHIILNFLGGHGPFYVPCYNFLICNYSFHLDPQWIWLLITLQSMACLAEIDKSIPFEVYLNYTIINIYHDEQLFMISILSLILRVLWDSVILVLCSFLLSPFYL